MDGGQNYGRVEVQFQGQWGRVADYHWTNTDATIACKQLGFKGGRASPRNMRINHPVRSAKVRLFGGGGGGGGGDSSVVGAPDS